MPTIDDAIQIYLFALGSGELGNPSPAERRSRRHAMLQTWRRSLKERGLPPEATFLDILNPSCVHEFATWLESATYQPRDKRKPLQRFKPATIRSYQYGLIHAVNYWHAKGWVPFVLAQSSIRRSDSAIPAYAARRHALEVPADFGFRMMAAAMSMPLPPNGQPGMYFQRRSVLRTRALIAVLCSTGLPLRDVCHMTADHLQDARNNGGLFSLRFESTGARAECVLSPSTLEVLDAYLAVCPTGDYLFQNFSVYVNSPSSRLSEGMARLIIQTVGRLAYTEGREDDPLPDFCTPRAFRHWFALNAVRQGVPIAELQRKMGHANAQTTRIVYGPGPIPPSTPSQVHD